MEDGVNTLYLDQMDPSGNDNTWLVYHFTGTHNAGIDLEILARILGNVKATAEMKMTFTYQCSLHRSNFSLVGRQIHYQHKQLHYQRLHERF